MRQKYHVFIQGKQKLWLHKVKLTQVEAQAMRDDGIEVLIALASVPENLPRVLVPVWTKLEAFWNFIRLW